MAGSLPLLLGKLCYIALLSFAFTGIISQNGTTQFSVVTEKVFSGNFQNNTLTVYKRDSQQAPYKVEVDENKTAPRHFYVIKYASDVFNYLMVERIGASITYYPLGWSDLNAITVKEITQRSKDIVAGKVPAVQKSAL
jgi:hypothetical protein